MSRHGTHFGNRKRRGQGLLSPLFVVCGLLLLLAAVGLRPAMSALAEHYRKESIAVRRPLADLDVSGLPSFVELPEEAAPILKEEDVDTDEYTWISLKDIDRTEAGLSSVALYVTYYSAPGDKVAHTPEVCYRQGGAKIRDVRLVSLDTPELAPLHQRIEMNLLEMEQGGVRQLLAYVFCANGEFTTDRERVRWILASPGDRHIYYSKIELLSAWPEDEAKAVVLERFERLMRQALAVLIADHFPTADQLKGR